jgi:hypothetical protein
MIFPFVNFILCPGGVLSPWTLFFAFFLQFFGALAASQAALEHQVEPLEEVREGKAQQQSHISANLKNND